jgi:hypothetical protein
MSTIQPISISRLLFEETASASGVASLCRWLNSKEVRNAANAFDICLTERDLPVWGPAPSNTYEIFSWEWISPTEVYVLLTDDSTGLFMTDYVARGDNSWLSCRFFPEDKLENGEKDHFTM